MRWTGRVVVVIRMKTEMWSQLVVFFDGVGKGRWWSGSYVLDALSCNWQTKNYLELFSGTVIGKLELLLHMVVVRLNFGLWYSRFRQVLKPFGRKGFWNMIWSEEEFEENGDEGWISISHPRHALTRVAVYQILVDFSILSELRIQKYTAKNNRRSKPKGNSLHSFDLIFICLRPQASPHGIYFAVIHCLVNNSLWMFRIRRLRSSNTRILL